jgi:hypothetical protein
LRVACLNTCNACATRGAIGASDIKTNKNKSIGVFGRRGVAAWVDGFDGKPSTLVEAADSRQGGNERLNREGREGTRRETKNDLFRE